jgi:Rrf2 family nitric oxide-sensitive transcriptional repressor
LDVNIQLVPARLSDDLKAMFSQTVEYALRAAVHLAAQAPRGCTTAELARATKVPPAYLSKVVQELARAKIVRSQRGSGGGLSLLPTPEELTILEVVNAVDPIRRIDRCPLDLVSHGERLCPLHKRMDAALEQVESAFRKTTLAEVLADPANPSRPLCDF